MAWISFWMAGLLAAFYVYRMAGIRDILRRLVAFRVHMGWFCLALGRGDALAHLSLAVDKDPRILERIVDDPVCRRHPHIIEGLRRISSDDLVTHPGGPAPTD